MHVLDHLADPMCKKAPENALHAEYRLLCSGIVHRPSPGDHTKSELTRLLLDPPLRLFVTNRPFADYPLELALQLVVPFVQERDSNGGTWIFAHHPDEEVAADLAALLTLLCRRLITVSGKCSQWEDGYDHRLFGRTPVPMPLVTSLRRTFWKPQASVVMTSFEESTVRDYNPCAKPLDPGWLTTLLLGLPRCEHAESIVASCRLYALAMELIHDRPELSYPLLISCVETIANAALNDFAVSDDEKVAHQRSVYKLARRMELGEDRSRQLAIEACRKEYWATRKFRKFLSDNVAESVWTEQDDLFRWIPLDRVPKRDDMDVALRNIYHARSKATHEGRPFPASAAYTGGPTLSMRAGHELFGSELPFPPVIWFERVVNSALCGFWERSMTRTG